MGFLRRELSGGTAQRIPPLGHVSKSRNGRNAGVSSDRTVIDTGATDKRNNR